MKVFNGARKLLDQYSIKGNGTKLIDWMWFGWGNPVGGPNAAFMRETIRNFKDHLVEPWQLIAGMPMDLVAANNETVLDKTTYLQYGAIEDEPSFPKTNLGFDSVHKMFQTADEYPELGGIMGNNMLMSLQFPRTFYFSNVAWDRTYAKNAEDDVLLDLGAQLHPDHKELIRSAFLALREEHPDTINESLQGITKLVSNASTGRPGAIGRFLFPDQMAIARNLQLQLEIRFCAAIPDARPSAEFQS